MHECLGYKAHRAVSSPQADDLQRDPEEAGGRSDHGESDWSMQPQIVNAQKLNPLPSHQHPCLPFQRPVPLTEIKVSPPKFDLAATNFPPLPGCVVSTQGEPLLENRMSDVVRGLYRDKVRKRTLNPVFLQIRGQYVSPFLAFDFEIHVKIFICH